MPQFPMDPNMPPPLPPDLAAMGMPPGGGAPPGMPPMDPAMMGGAPPGMPPMDPAMMGGAPPGMPPDMAGAMPPDLAGLLGGGPPPGGAGMGPDAMLGAEEVMAPMSWTPADWEKVDVFNDTICPCGGIAMKKNGTKFCYTGPEGQEPSGAKLLDAMGGVEGEELPDSGAKKSGSESKKSEKKSEKSEKK